MFIQINYVTVEHIHGKTISLEYRGEGDARTGYFIPGCDGIVGWRLPGNSSAAAVAVAVAAAPRKWVFGDYCFPSFSDT